MAASVALHPAEKPRNRSLEARRAARRAKFERERLVVDFLNRGVSVAEIAERIGVTEKRMRALVKEILARRMAAAPEDYAALQASRLNEALLVAMSAMAPENLKAVALVVRIVRELDRYHGYVGAEARAHLPRRSGEDVGRSPTDGVWNAGCDADGLPALVVQAFGQSKQLATPHPSSSSTASPAEKAPRPPRRPRCARKWRPKRLKRRNLRPKMSRSRTRSKRRRSKRKMLAPRRRTTREWKRRTTPCRRPPQSDPPHAGAETAPQAVENIDSAPGTDSAMAEASPSGEPSPHAGAFASGAASPEETPPPSNPIEPQPDDWPDITTVVLAPDPAAPGGFRRMRIRILRNGVAACADAA